MCVYGFRARPTEPSMGLSSLSRSLGGALGWSPASEEGHHAVRDENYLIETFSFIYYSVSERCHLARARAEARPLAARRGNWFRGCEAAGFARKRGRKRERERERRGEGRGKRARRSPLAAHTHLVAFIEKLSRCKSDRARSFAMNWQELGTLEVSFTRRSS